MKLFNNTIVDGTHTNSVLQNVLELADTLIQRGVTGTRKRFTRKNFVKLRWIKLKDLKIDDKYQRLINSKFIKDAKEDRKSVV